VRYLRHALDDLPRIVDDDWLQELRWIFALSPQTVPSTSKPSSRSFTRSRRLPK
jgi:hypothetical protein